MSKALMLGQECGRCCRWDSLNSRCPCGFRDGGLGLQLEIQLEEFCYMASNQSQRPWGRPEQMWQESLWGGDRWRDRRAEQPGRQEGWVRGTSPARLLPPNCLARDRASSPDKGALS